MARNCNCSAGCGPQDSDENGVTRREFLTLVSAGTAGLWLGGAAGAQTSGAPPASAQTVASPIPADELARWKQALHAPAVPRLYRSDTHTDARMHLGGIGTGNFEIGADGQFTTWQLFNTLRDGHVPFYFGVRAGNTAKLLQTVGGPEVPRVRHIEMTGEYPLATLRFVDPELPVRLEMTAFSPFAPLDTRLSSMPVAAFVFRIHNPTRQRQRVSLAAFLPNPVGYDALGQIDGLEHPNFGGNVNSFEQENRAAILSMRAVPGAVPTLDKPLRMWTNVNIGALNTPPADRPATLTVQSVDGLATHDATGQGQNTASVIWLENAPADLAEPTLRAAPDAVQAGAVLVFAGDAMPLLQSYAQISGGRPLNFANGRPDTIFEDFEGDYAAWKAQGDAFGQRPAAGTQANQQAVSGFAGKQLVNSYAGTDEATGRLVSKAFTIERNFIRFLIGGGSHSTTQIRLVVDGKVVQAAAGRNEERLMPTIWDVRPWQGRTAHLEIVDDQKGAWGHINVDQIEFSDLPGSRATLELLAELLPARFSNLVPDSSQPNAVRFENLEVLPGAQQAVLSNGLQSVSKAFGTGQVVLVGGSLLKTGDENFSSRRQRAYAMLSEIAGAKYQASQGTLSSAPGFGTVALSTSGPHPVALTDVPDLEAAWQLFAQSGWAAGQKPGPVSASHGRQSTLPSTSPASAAGRTVRGALASTVEVRPGQTVEVPFFLAWHYPNKYAADGALMGNHYTTLWPDARSVAREATANFAAIREKTERFRKSLYDSTLPYWMLDCLSSQASIIRHIGVVFRIRNGDIYGWEGSNGCCPPTCTHVWGYEQSLARLFPDLEREMRRIDFKHQQNADGGINNRTEVPSPPRPTGEHPFVDGHASSVLKAYREALNHPDDSWLREYWPHIQQAVEYLIARDAAISGGTPSGTIEDDQWNTYDEALHGVTTFIGTYYLAALRAGEELARRRGDRATAERYHGIFEKGQQRLIELCWNGEYYQQHLPDYDKRPGEIGPGCMADQLIGQWWAHQLGLGYVLPQEQVRTALKSIYKYNFLLDHTNWQHNWRKFAGGKDKGLLICTWPRGGRPANPMLYVDEVWTGIEYQVASHMIYEGMNDEAFAVIKGVRDRYDGVPRAPIQRNPWNEIECGGHYARAMSSWSILLAMSGWEYDGIAQSLRFTPRHTPANFKSFFCGPQGWGNLSQRRRGATQTNEIAVADGRLMISQLHLDPLKTIEHVEVTINKKKVRAAFDQSPQGLAIHFPAPVAIEQGQLFRVRLS